jgi:hypothetical protein
MRNKMKKISKAAKRAIEAGGTFTPTPRAYAQGIYTSITSAPMRKWGLGDEELMRSGRVDGEGFVR